MLKDAKKSITLKIEGLPPLVYRTKLMHFLETKLTLSSHTWGDLRSNWSSTSIQGSACYKLIIHITHHLLLNFASSFRRRDRPVRLCTSHLNHPQSFAGQMTRAKPTSKVRQRYSITSSSAAHTFRKLYCTRWTIMKVTQSLHKK